MHRFHAHVRGDRTTHLRSALKADLTIVFHAHCAFVSRADYDALRFMTHCVAFITRLRSAFVLRVRFVFLNASARLALAFVEISFQFSFEVVFLMQVQVMFFLRSAFNFRLRSSF